VGITRAEDTLFITHARGRRRNGEFMPSMPSSFLREIPEALLKTRQTSKLRGSGRAADTGFSWGRSRAVRMMTSAPAPSARRPDSVRFTPVLPPRTNRRTSRAFARRARQHGHSGRTSPVLERA
jgi:DNA helicase-2/ATP-dependent DNA helicase PcrA